MSLQGGINLQQFLTCSKQGKSNERRLKHQSISSTQQAHNEYHQSLSLNHQINGTTPSQSLPITNPAKQNSLPLKKTQFAPTSTHQHHAYPSKQPKQYLQAHNPHQEQNCQQLTIPLPADTLGLPQHSDPMRYSSPRSKGASKGQEGAWRPNGLSGAEESRMVNGWAQCGLLGSLSGLAEDNEGEDFGGSVQVQDGGRGTIQDENENALIVQEGDRQCTQFPAQFHNDHQLQGNSIIFHLVCKGEYVEFQTNECPVLIQQWIQQQNSQNIHNCPQVTSLQKQISQIDSNQINGSQCINNHYKRTFEFINDRQIEVNQQIFQINAESSSQALFLLFQLLSEHQSNPNEEIHGSFEILKELINLISFFQIKPQKHLAISNFIKHTLSHSYDQFMPKLILNCSNNDQKNKDFLIKLYEICKTISVSIGVPNENQESYSHPQQLLKQIIWTARMENLSEKTSKPFIIQDSHSSNKIQMKAQIRVLKNSQSNTYDVYLEQVQDLSSQKPESDPFSDQFLVSKLQQPHCQAQPTVRKSYHRRSSGFLDNLGQYGLFRGARKRSEQTGWGLGLEADRRSRDSSLGCKSKRNSISNLKVPTLKSRSQSKEKVRFFKRQLSVSAKNNFQTFKNGKKLQVGSNTYARSRLSNDSSRFDSQPCFYQSLKKHNSLKYQQSLQEFKKQIQQPIQRRINNTQLNLYSMMPNLPTLQTQNSKIRTNAQIISNNQILRENLQNKVQQTQGVLSDSKQNQICKKSGKKKSDFLVQPAISRVRAKAPHHVARGNRSILQTTKFHSRAQSQIIEKKRNAIGPQFIRQINFKNQQRRSRSRNAISLNEKSTIVAGQSHFSAKNMLINYKQIVQCRKNSQLYQTQQSLMPTLSGLKTGSKNKVVRFNKRRHNYSESLSPLQKFGANRLQMRSLSTKNQMHPIKISKVHHKSGIQSQVAASIPLKSNKRSALSCSNSKFRYPLQIRDPVLQSLHRPFQPLNLPRSSNLIKKMNIVHKYAEGERQDLPNNDVCRGRHNSVSRIDINQINHNTDVGIQKHSESENKQISECKVHGNNICQDTYLNNDLIKDNIWKGEDDILRSNRQTQRLHTAANSEGNCEEQQLLNTQLNAEGANIPINELGAQQLSRNVHESLIENNSEANENNGNIDLRKLNEPGIFTSGTRVDRMMKVGDQQRKQDSHSFVNNETHQPIDHLYRDQENTLALHDSSITNNCENQQQIYVNMQICSSEIRNLGCKLSESGGDFQQQNGSGSYLISNKPSGTTPSQPPIKFMEIQVDLQKGSTDRAESYKDVKTLISMLQDNQELKEGYFCQKLGYLPISSSSSTHLHINVLLYTSKNKSTFDLNVQILQIIDTFERILAGQEYEVQELVQNGPTLNPAQLSYLIDVINSLNTPEPQKGSFIFKILFTNLLISIQSDTKTMNQQQINFFMKTIKWSLVESQTLYKCNLILNLHQFQGCFWADHVQSIIQDQLNQRGYQCNVDTTNNLGQITPQRSTMNDGFNDETGPKYHRFENLNSSIMQNERCLPLSTSTKHQIYIKLNDVISTLTSSQQPVPKKQLRPKYPFIRSSSCDGVRRGRTGSRKVRSRGDKENQIDHLNQDLRFDQNRVQGRNRQGVSKGFMNDELSIRKQWNSCFNFDQLIKTNSIIRNNGSKSSKKQSKVSNKTKHKTNTNQENKQINIPQENLHKNQPLTYHEVLKKRKQLNQTKKSKSTQNQLQDFLKQRQIVESCEQNEKQLNHIYRSSLGGSGHNQQAQNFNKQHRTRQIISSLVDQVKLNDIDQLKNQYKQRLSIGNQLLLLNDQRNFLAQMDFASPRQSKLHLISVAQSNQNLVDPPAGLELGNDTKIPEDEFIGSSYKLSKIQSEIQLLQINKTQSTCNLNETQQMGQTQDNFHAINISKPLLNEHYKQYSQQNPRGTGHVFENGMKNYQQYDNKLAQQAGTQCSKQQYQTQLTFNNNANQEATHLTEEIIMCSSSQQEPSLIPPESEGSVNQFHGNSHNITQQFFQNMQKLSTGSIILNEGPIINNITPDNILVNSLNSSYVKNQSSNINSNFEVVTPKPQTKPSNQGLLSNKHQNLMPTSQQKEIGTQKFLKNSHQTPVVHTISPKTAQENQQQPLLQSYERLQNDPYQEISSLIALIPQKIMSYPEFDESDNQISQFNKPQTGFVQNKTTDTVLHTKEDVTGNGNSEHAGEVMTPLMNQLIKKNNIIVNQNLQQVVKNIDKNKLDKYENNPGNCVPLSAQDLSSNKKQRMLNLSKLVSQEPEHQSNNILKKHANSVFLEQKKAQKYRGFFKPRSKSVNNILYRQNRSNNDITSVLTQSDNIRQQLRQKYQVVSQINDKKQKMQMKSRKNSSRNRYLCCKNIKVNTQKQGVITKGANGGDGDIFSKKTRNSISFDIRKAQLEILPEDKQTCQHDLLNTSTLQAGSKCSNNSANRSKKRLQVSKYQAMFQQQNKLQNKAIQQLHQTTIGTSLNKQDDLLVFSNEAMNKFSSSTNNAPNQTPDINLNLRDQSMNERLAMSILNSPNSYGSNARSIMNRTFQNYRDGNVNPQKHNPLLQTKLSFAKNSIPLQNQLIKQESSPFQYQYFANVNPQWPSNQINNGNDDNKLDQNNSNKLRNQFASMMLDDDEQSAATLVRWQNLLDQRRNTMSTNIFDRSSKAGITSGPELFCYNNYQNPRNPQQNQPFSNMDENNLLINKQSQKRIFDRSLSMQVNGDLQNLRIPKFTQNINQRNINFIQTDQFDKNEHQDQSIADLNHFKHTTLNNINGITSPFLQASNARPNTSPGALANWHPHAQKQLPKTSHPHSCTSDSQGAAAGSQTPGCEEVAAGSWQEEAIERVVHNQWSDKIHSLHIGEEANVEVGLHQQRYYQRKQRLADEASRNVHQRNFSISKRVAGVKSQPLNRNSLKAVNVQKSQIFNNECFDNDLGYAQNQTGLNQVTSTYQLSNQHHIQGHVNQNQPQYHDSQLENDIIGSQTQAKQGDNTYNHNKPIQYQNEILNIFCGMNDKDHSESKKKQRQFINDVGSSTFQDERSQLAVERVNHFLQQSLINSSSNKQQQMHIYDENPSEDKQMIQQLLFNSFQNQKVVQNGVSGGNHSNMTSAKQQVISAGELSLSDNTQLILGVLGLGNGTRISKDNSTSLSRHPGSLSYAAHNPQAAPLHAPIHSGTHLGGPSTSSFQQPNNQNLLQSNSFQNSEQGFEIGKHLALSNATSQVPSKGCSIMSNEVGQLQINPVNQVGNLSANFAFISNEESRAGQTNSTLMPWQPPPQSNHIEPCGQFIKFKQF